MAKKAAKNDKKKDKQIEKQQTIKQQSNDNT